MEMAQFGERAAGKEVTRQEGVLERGVETRVEFAACGRDADEDAVAAGRIHDALAGPRLGEPIDEARDWLRGKELADHVTESKSRNARNARKQNLAAGSSRRERQRNSKLQISFKFQVSKKLLPRLGAWRLEFPWSLGVGVWSF